MFRRLIAIFAISLSLSFAGAHVVAAQTKASVSNDILSQVNSAGGDKGAGLVDSKDPRVLDPRSIVAQIIRLALGLMGTILLVLNVYAGFLWATAGGNEEQVAQAKTTIRNATIGLIVVMASYAITIAVTNIASGQPLSTGTITDGQDMEGAISDCLHGDCY